MRRLLLLLIVLGLALGGCGSVEWFPEQGISAFSFSPESVVGVTTNSVQTSDAVTLTIRGVSPAISVTGGEYSLNGAAFTTTAGTAKNGDRVVVRHTSASTPGTTVRTNLTVGDKSASFSSTTEGFADSTRFNVTPNSSQTSGVLIVGIQGGGSAPISVSSGSEYSVNGAAFTSAAGTVNQRDTVVVRHTAANGTTATTVTTTLTIGTKNYTFVTSTAGDFPAEEIRFNVPAGSTQTSGILPIRVEGAATSPISVTGGSYSINGGQFVTTAGTVKTGDQVVVRHTAANGTTETTVTTTLTVGTKTFTFVTSTGAVAAQTVRGTGAAGSFVTVQTQLRLVPGSYTISVDPQNAGLLPGYSLDGETFDDPEIPKSVALTDKQTLHLQDITPDTAGAQRTTRFLIGNVPVTLIITAQ